MEGMGRRHASPFPVAAATAALAALAAGCGGQAPTTHVEGRTLRLRLDEYRVLPERITIAAGRVRIVARNVGRLTHNVAVVDFERPPGNVEGHQYARTDTAHPGGVVRTRARLRPGHYRIACTLSNHDNLGQYAELTVVPAT
jgi:plastocyanin